MITILFYLVCILALWHFIVQSIIVPSARATTRLRLFALRDKLRALCVERKTDAKEFEEAQRIINNVIRLAPSIDPFMIAEWEMKVKSDKELAQRLERRQKEFEAIVSKEVKELTDTAYGLAAEAVRINSAGWIIYVIPVVIGVAIGAKIRREVMKMTNATERELPISTACPV